MTRTLTSVLLSLATCSAQIVLPEGTKIRARLDQTISSGTAEQGQPVELSVTDAVRVGDTVVIAEGARITGTVTMAQEKRRMGRAGKLDFSIDRVKTADNQWIPLRYTVTKKSGQSHAMSTGILTAGVAVVFWPAAPVLLLRKGQDININRGTTFDVFTDANHVAAASSSHFPSSLPSVNTSPAFPSGAAATVSITSSVAVADIEVNGVFVGNTPTTLQLPSGQHRIAVKNGPKMWQRTVQVNPGSTVTLNANLQ